MSMPVTDAIYTHQLFSLAGRYRVQDHLVTCKWGSFSVTRQAGINEPYDSPSPPSWFWHSLQKPYGHYCWKPIMLPLRPKNCCDICTALSSLFFCLCFSDHKWVHLFIQCIFVCLFSIYNLNEQLDILGNTTIHFLAQPSKRIETTPMSA